MIGARIEELKNRICDSFVASIVGGSLMKAKFRQSLNEQMMSWRFTINLEDDVTAVYKIYAKVQKEEFF